MGIGRNRIGHSGLSRLAMAAAVACGLLACVFQGGGSTAVQEWWAGNGPVIRHETFPEDCGLCHEGTDWHTIKASFDYDHLAETGVALGGAHADAQCLRCHNDRGPVELFSQQGCAGCHDDPHQRELGRDCEACHSQNDWEPLGAVAEHAETRFPLAGAHAAVACWRCHPGAEVGRFARVDTACESCHAADLARADDPDHVAAGWVQSCEECHAPTSWGADGFVHAFFPLAGAHASADCSACHTGGQFAGTPNDCVDCHLGEFQTTTDPDHVALGFSTSCEECHVPVTWKGATFPHTGIVSGCDVCHLDDYQATVDPDHAALGFPLACESCHDTVLWENGVFDHPGIVSGCDQCHLDDYQATKDPNHALLGFPTTCEDCHDTSLWENGFFDHAGIVDGCETCHLGDYNQTTDPDHQKFDFPLDCEDCHDTRSWLGALFDHRGIVDGCAQCHLEEWEQTTSPDHAAVGFPKTCHLCHAPTAWEDGTFDHQFPIESGKHKNLKCQDCHTSWPSVASFSCIDCHEHKKSEMDDEHDDVPGYSYDTPSCYACHPTGED